jgi:hypothetical protein
MIKEKEQVDEYNTPYCIACDDSGCKYCFKTNPNLEGGE